MKHILPDSYTIFKNKIGLTIDNEFIEERKDIVLSWPYKDCILIGNMARKDQKKNEIFLNKTIASDKGYYLLEPKMFTNGKEIDKDGEYEFTKFKTDINGNIKNNLVIKGDNLLVLHCLKNRFEGKIKLIYIDPPYNTGNNSFKYKDNFDHSNWLTFMKNRLEIAKKLLSNDGSIYIQIDSNEGHYLKVLMDEIFGRENFQREIIWDLGNPSGYKSLAKNWIRSHDTILFYTKSKYFIFNKMYIPYSASDLEKYPEKKSRKGLAITDVWKDIPSAQKWGNEKRNYLYDTQKPVKLLKRIIEVSSNPGDIVLDFFAGSGTTGVAASQLLRQFILIEQLEQAQDIIKQRLNNINYIYFELMKGNEVLAQQIKKAKTEEELIALRQTIKEKIFIDIKETNENLSIEDQKKQFLGYLDENDFYVNLNDIDNKQYNIINQNIKLNKEFYGI